MGFRCGIPRDLRIQDLEVMGHTVVTARKKQEGLKRSLPRSETCSGYQSSGRQRVGTDRGNGKVAAPSMGDRHERVRNAQPIGTEARRLIPTSLDQAHFDERAGRVGRGGRATLKGTLLLTSIGSKAGIEAVQPREGSSPFYLTFFTLTSGLPLPLTVPIYHGCAPNQSGYPVQCVRTTMLRVQDKLRI